MSTPASSRFLRLVIPLLVAAGLAALLPSLLRRDETDAPAAEPGHVVEIEVVDATGRPVPRARARARYGEGDWRDVTSTGKTTLTHVLLRAEESPSPEALAAAIEVEAPEHAFVPGTHPVVTSRAGGGWSARAVLEPYGRIHVVLTGVGHADARAYIERDGAMGRVVVPEAGQEVARAGSPATWRVFGSVESVVLRVEGHTGTALRRRVIRAPGAGYLREVVIEPEAARPITGRFLVPVGTPPPTLAGHVEVTELGEDGSALRAPDVVVNDDGTFHVPYAAKARYRLVPVLGFVIAAVQEVEGGDVVDVDVDRTRPWANIPTQAWGARRRTIHLSVSTRPDEASAMVPHGLFTAGWPDGEGSDEAVWAVAFPGAGTYLIKAVALGSEEAPPATGSATVFVGDRGPHELALPLEDAPWGRVLVRLVGPDGAAAAGTVVLAPDDGGTWSQTVLPRIRAHAAFSHVPIGAVRVEVRWQDPTRPRTVLSGEVEEGATLELEARADADGDVRLPGR